jgi:hypothetical protein
VSPLLGDLPCPHDSLPSIKFGITQAETGGKDVDANASSRELVPDDIAQAAAILARSA